MEWAVCWEQMLVAEYENELIIIMRKTLQKPTFWNKRERLTREFSIQRAGSQNTILASKNLPRIEHSDEICQNH